MFPVTLPMILAIIIAQMAVYNPKVRCGACGAA
jgi:hypothetical protein